MAIEVIITRRTAQEWTALNPVLPLKNVGYETDTGKYKSGTGSADWTALPYDDTYNFAQTQSTIVTVNTSHGLPFVGLLTSNALLAAGGSETSEWFDFQMLDVDYLLIARTTTLGIYSMEIDWSSDSLTVDIVEPIIVANNTSVSKTIASRYGRVRIQNKDATDAFTTHKTVVTGRSI